MSKNNAQFQDFHVGNLIINFMKKCSISQAYLAREINMATPNVNRLLKRESMDTFLIYEISFKLQHNFFADISGDTDDEDSFALADVPLGKHIEKRLKELNMTQSHFASILGVSSAEVSRLIKKNSFDAKKLLNISRLLDYNFFRDYYNFDRFTEVESCQMVGVIKKYELTHGKINEPVTPEAISSNELLNRYEELIIDNNRLKTENQRLSSEVMRLKKLLDTLGVNYINS